MSENLGVEFTSGVADGGVAHLLDTAVAYTSGSLLSLRNKGTEKFGFAYDGTLTLHGSLKADTIAEKTAAAGVTVDELLIKDGGIPVGAVTAHQAALSVAWSQLTATPTTLAGYGITDAAPLSHVSDVANPHSVTQTQVGLSAVENTALSTWAGTTNITTLGTISAGTWGGTAIDAGDLAGATLAAGVLASSLTSLGTLGDLTVTNPIVGSVTGSSGSATGNAATATALETARAINGVNFDGTAPITITAAAGTLTGTALNATVVTSSLTAVGTLLDLTVTNQITGSISGSSGSCTGLAATATALATPRDINGVAFDGTANITVTAAAGTLTGNTLNATVVTSSLTSVGTLGDLTVTNPITGSVTGSAGSCTGNAATATLAATVTVVDSTSATCWVAVFDSATGSLAAKTDGGLTYAATTGILTATGFSGPLTGAVTGNASTATALQNARDINGVSFDGTANITVTAAAGTLTGATLNATVTASSLTSIGTLASGAVPASLVTAGTFGTGAYVFDNTVSGITTLTATTLAGTLSTAAQPNVTSLGTIASLVASTADIDGGTIDATAIGGGTPAAGAFTTLDASDDTVLAGDLTVTGANVGIGTAALSQNHIRIISTALSGDTDPAGVYVNTTFNHEATSTGKGIRVIVKTKAAAYTMTALSGVAIDAFTKGAGSTITTAYGLKIAAVTVGATNYAIHTGTGLVQFGGGVTCTSTLAVTSDFAVATNKFQVTAATGDTTVGGDLVVSGTGPHAIGGAAHPQFQFQITGAFTPSSWGAAVQIGSTLTGSVGNDIYGLNVQPVITEAASGTHGLVAVVQINPNSMVGAGATTTVAASLRIHAAPTIGATNWALLVAAGNTSLGGTLAVTGGFGCNAAAAQTAYASGGALAAYTTGAFGLDSDANMTALHALVVAMRAALVANGILS